MRERGGGDEGTGGEWMLRKVLCVGFRRTLSVGGKICIC